MTSLVENSATAGAYGLPFKSSNTEYLIVLNTFISARLVEFIMAFYS